MRKVLLVAGVVIAAAVVYLLAWPVPVEPVAWNAPESAGYAGAHARNERLARVQLVQVTPEVGPEHIAFGPDGKLYTATLSGAVLRMNADGSSIETVANTDGRPLGLDFDANGRLIIADALRGLLALESDGQLLASMRKHGRSLCLQNFVSDIHWTGDKHAGHKTSLATDFTDYHK